MPPQEPVPNPSNKAFRTFGAGGAPHFPGPGWREPLRPTGATVTMPSDFMPTGTTATIVV